MDPIVPVAEAIAEEVRLLCFDEFQVGAKFRESFAVIESSLGPVFQIYFLSCR